MADALSLRGPGAIKFIQEVARREVERHRTSMIGITASPPKYVDVNGIYEWVCDVRVGNKHGQGLVKNVLISQYVFGVVTDINIPVLIERSETGRLTITARVSIRLPNIDLTIYSWGALKLIFAANRYQDENGDWKDGYGYTAPDPTSETIQQQYWEWQQRAALREDVDTGDDDDTIVEFVESGWELT